MYDENGAKKIIVIDFEMVSVHTRSLIEKLCLWYLAKLNREKGNFTDTERVRFLLSYMSHDIARWKTIAGDIESMTVQIQKKGAKRHPGFVFVKIRNLISSKTLNSVGFTGEII